MVLTAYAFGLGFLHGLGPDHLMAIATLSVTSRAHDHAARPLPFRVAVEFALGHALLLLVGAVLVFVAGWHIPALVEQAGEIVGGALLIALGVLTIVVARGSRLYGHTHPHGEPAHTHWHMHFGRPGRHEASGHSHVPGVLGAVFAVSGLRALTMMAPFEAAAGDTLGASLAMVVWLVAIFAIGIVASMSLFGIVLSRVVGSVKAVRAVGRTALVLTACASVALGVYWIASAIG
jgi:nickel/cobalt transporter (NicO) family protein